MRNKPLFILALTIGQILFWSVQCSADDGAVHLKAAHIEYDYEEKIVSASDEVVITYKDITISAIRAFIAIDENQLEADGSIEVKRGEETYYGDHLSYDFKKERGYIEPLNLEIRDSEIDGIVIGYGKQAEIQGDNSKIYMGSMTTCELVHPHYRLTATEMEYFPNDRIIFRHTLYYEGSVPILYWPYLCISLKEEDNNFLTPIIGHDETMGWFLTLGYRYYLNSKLNGIAYFDWMSILGRRYRIEQSFDLGERDQLRAEFAWLDNKQTDNNELSTTLQYNKYFGKDWNLVLDYKWAQETKDETIDGWSVPSEDLINNIYFQGELKKTSGNPYIRMNYSDTASSRYYAIAPSINWQPFKGATLNISGSLSNVKYKTSEDDDDLDTYGLTLLYNQVFSDHFSFNLNHQYTSYGRTVTDILNYTGPNWKLGWFRQTQLSSDITYKLGLSQDGYKWGITLNSTSLPIYESKENGFRIRTGWYLKERLYWNDYQKNDGEGYIFSDQLAANASIQAEKDLTDNFKANFSLGWTETTSYYVDERQFPGLTETFNRGLGTTYGLRYHNEEINLDADFNGGYNIQSGLWEQQNLSTSWEPNDISSFRFNLSYTPDPEYMTTSLALTYKPNNNTYIGVDYSYTSSTWSNGIGSLNVQTDIVRPIGDLWTIELHSRYDFFDRYINYARANITYDWHCRKIIFGYDATREQFVLQMVIKAFPSHPIGLSNQEDFFWDWYNEVSQ